MMHDPKNPLEKIEVDYWKSTLEKKGIDGALKRADSRFCSNHSVARKVIDDYVKYKEIKHLEQQEKLNLESMKIARKANLHGLIAIGISIVALFVTVLLAIADKQA